MQILDLLAQGDLVFDVGAHKGDKCAQYLERGARVVCFEPQPDLAAALRERFAEHPLPGAVRVEALGLSSAPGALPFRVCETCTDLSSFSEAWPKLARFGTEQRWRDPTEIPVSTLDEMIHKYGLPRFTKIDAEGHEPRVLEGLTKGLPLLSFEFHRERPEAVATCMRRLLELGMARFNISFWDDPRMLADGWLDSDQLFSYIGSYAEELLWGDVYAAS